MPRLIPVVGQKGGVGKTTTVMSLAAVASESSRVLVVDVDPQRSASKWADRAGENLPFDLTDEADPAHLARLKELPYDLVLVDTPGSLEGRDVLTTVANSADFLILPTEPAPLAIDALIPTIQTVVLPSGKPYRVLLTKVDPRVPQDAADAEDLFDGAGIAHFRSHVRQYKVHSTAPIEGLVVTQYAPLRQNAKAVEDYRRITTEMFAIFANGNG